MGSGGSQQSSGGGTTLMAQGASGGGKLEVLAQAGVMQGGAVQGATIQPGTGGAFGGMYCSPGWTMGAPPPAASPDTSTKTTTVSVQCYQQTGVMQGGAVQGTTIQPGTGGAFGGMYCSPGWTMGAPPPGANSTTVSVKCYQQTTPTSNVAAPATGTSSYVSFGSPYMSVGTGQPMWAYVVAISTIVIALVLAKKSK